MPRPLSVLLSFLLLHATGLAQPHPADSLSAPNGALHLRLVLDAQGVPTYTVTYGPGRVQLVAPSRLGFVFRGGEPLQQGLVLERREQGAYDSTWTAVWGPQRRVGKPNASSTAHTGLNLSPSSGHGAHRRCP